MKYSENSIFCKKQIEAKNNYKKWKWLIINLLFVFDRNSEEAFNGDLEL